MQQLSLTKLIMRRLADGWKLLLSVFLGITVATTLAAGTPVYLTSLGQLSFHASLDRIPTRVLDIEVSTSGIPLSEKSIQQAEQSLVDAIDRNFSPIFLGLERFLRGETSVLGTPNRPLPEGGGTGVVLSRGYLQHLTNLQTHVRFVEGQLPTAIIAPGEGRGPLFQAAISRQTASDFNLAIGDTVTLSPSLEVATVLSAEIVGILEPSEASREIWSTATQILDPPPLTTPAPLLVQVNLEEPPVALFVAGDVILDLGGDLQPPTSFGQDAYFQGVAYLAGHPARPLPPAGGRGLFVPLGFLQHLSNLEQHARFIEGRMAGDEVSVGPTGPELEAVVPEATAIRYSLAVGDIVIVSPTLGARPVISARIVGILEAADPSDVYWASASLFLRPSPLTQDGPLLVELDPDVPVAPLFVTQEAMVEAITQTYPTSIVRPVWSVIVDKDRLKDLSVAEARRRLRDFQDEVAAALPGSSVSTDTLQGLTEVGEQRSFFARVPLLLILAVMVATVLTFLLMMVSYLVHSRERDTALLQTRGVGTLQLLRLYAVEGVLMTAVAVVLAPLLAIAIVALAGFFPPFREMTDGGTMPVILEPTPFLVAFGVGLLSLAIFVLPGVASAPGGVLLQRLRASRPPSLPLLHRYYIDVAVLVLGGLAFWELEQRGNIVSGGLFKEVEVNETLLVAPVLFLIVVALVFVRLFPLVMRFIIGESPVLVHLLAALSVLALAAGIVFRETRDGDVVSSFGPVALALAAGAFYWATTKATTSALRLAGILVQTGLVAGFVALEPVESDELLFPAVLGLVAVVPAQLIFLLLTGLARVSPVWIVMGMRQMARNPLQYTWLVLLLVMVTGLGILGTTVGGTLERSQRERIQYDVPTDVRVSVSPRGLGSPESLRQQFLDVPGVAVAHAAFRGAGIVGVASPKVLALESSTFADISWYRDDFADRPLGTIMSELQSAVEADRIKIPEGATTIGGWFKPLDFTPFVPVLLQIKDAMGREETIILGDLGPPEWTRLSAEIPDNLEDPLYLVSVLIFRPGGFGASGALLVDDIHVTVGESEERQVLEDFEAETLRWSPIVTAALSPEGVSFETGDVNSGAKAARFSYGNTTFQGLQGFYHTQTPDPLPIVISSSLAAASGYGVGDTLLARVNRRFVPVAVAGVIDYFPTLTPDGPGFFVTDLDALLSRLNVLIDFHSERPNEFFIGLSPAPPGAAEALSGIVGRMGDVNDGVDQLEALSEDPYVSAGWKPMTVVSSGIAVLAATVGYMTYLLLIARRTGNELATLRSSGLSRFQQIGLLGFEHLAIAAMGMGLGIWAGFQMSRLMVSSLAVTETGVPVIPPVIMTPNWSLMLPTIAAIIGVFLVALFVLSWGMSRLEIHAIFRMRVSES